MEEDRDSGRERKNSAESLFSAGCVFIIRIGNGLKPGVLVGLRIALDSEMSKPAVGRRTMPVIDIRGDFDHISGQKFPSLSAALLIEADAADRNQKLSAGMTMPVVAASWLECDIGDRHPEPFISRQRSKIRFFR